MVKKLNSIIMSDLFIVSGFSDQHYVLIVVF